MPRYIPVTDKEGAVRMVKHPGRVPLEGVPAEAVISFQQMVLNAYRQVEADGKYQGPYPKGARQVHEAALVRDEHSRA